MSGVGITGQITPLNGGAFPVFEDIDGKGGFRVVANNTARDAIITLDRKEGMLVYSVASALFYKLASNLTTWNQVTLTSFEVGTDNGDMLIWNGSTWKQVGIKTTALTDANATINYGTAPCYSWLGAFTANRTFTLGITGALNGYCITVVLCDVSAFTVAMVNGGPAGGASDGTYTKPAGVAQVVSWRFNGADWILAGVQDLVYTP